MAPKPVFNTSLTFSPNNDITVDVPAPSTPVDPISKNPLAINNKFALVFGWVNADFKEVDKLAAEYYRTHGYTAIVSTSSGSDQGSIATRDLELQEFDDLIAYLAEQKVIDPIGTKHLMQSTKVVIHVLSHGGLFKMCRLLAAVDAKKMQFKKTAVILDSCPGIVTPELLAGMASSGIQNDVLKNVSYWGSFVAGSVYATCVSISAPYATSDKNAEGGNLVGARLFLYSDADQVINSGDVHKRADEARAEGLVVEEHIFHGSDHIRHAVLHKKEYWDTVASFISKNA
ncbi:hypothetical protein BCR33DRAFT_731724 [Rhizoclosmatium globosum]|uniref:Alpha/beta-hydrolase n=1 Tax=Rhizoclosmatium globosum TaxID=329046 RepID=A0A1Y1ZTX3_9FUNG|nr:hypothetical protein BCR33DRAFT_731724 [Rhizoclosmatium globosum]|eukprot:ORY13670.1 hypothetical protein BCR33DRAFT_731724 [Rhizoclosmatium globosum]